MRMFPSLSTVEFGWVCLCVVGLSFHCVFWFLVGVQRCTLLVFYLSFLHSGCYSPFTLCCRWLLSSSLGLLGLLVWWSVLDDLCAMVTSCGCNSLLDFTDMFLMYGSGYPFHRLCCRGLTIFDKVVWVSFWWKMSYTLFFMVFWVTAMQQ